MKAVLMAGGFGTRIQPLTSSLPKPMLPLLNIPIMEHIIMKLRSVNITEIIVLLYFKPEIIKNYFGNGEKWDTSLTYVLPNDDYGTAGAVKKAKKYLNDTFMVISGDLVTDFDFKKIVKFHHDKNSKVTITLTSVKDPLQFGIIICDKDSRIKRFLEKPGWGEVFSDTINTGIYFLSPDILDEIPDNIPFDFSKELFPKLMKKGIPLWGYTAKGYWKDIGNPNSYRDVFYDIFNGLIKLHIKGKKIEKRDSILFVDGNSNIASSVKTSKNIIIGKNVVIENNCQLENCIIGDNSYISNNTIIKNSVIWNKTHIENNCVINNAIICNNNIIGEHTHMEYGSIISEHCEIGKLTVFENDIIVWPNKTIEDASIITSNIIWTDKYKKSLFENGVIHGRSNIELSCDFVTKLGESIASTLPVSSYIYISRDYHRASRMLKRAFVGGLLSCGINAIDLKYTPSILMRYKLSKTNNVLGGIHFRQSVKKHNETDILFFDKNSIYINTNIEKSCERIYFRENFRRVENTNIGEIIDGGNVKNFYFESLLSSINKDTIRSKKLKVAINMLFGSASLIYPEIINQLNIDNIVINAYSDEFKLSNLNKLIEHSRQETSQVVKALNMDCGFLIYPSGQKLEIITDQGEILNPHYSVMIILLLLNKTKKHKINIYLSQALPDIMDKKLENLNIKKGKMTNLNVDLLKNYNFVSDLNGHCMYTDFSFIFDSIFSSIKILEMLSETDLKLSDIKKEIPNFYFNHVSIPCKSTQKGSIMRYLNEDSFDKGVSYDDGIKIYLNSNSWVLVTPEQYGEFINLYVQSDNENSGLNYLNDYKTKIENFLYKETK